MSAPAELSFDEILKFMLAHNGRVTNHELVKHFKVFLMNPDRRDEARSTFKKHVNALANIKNQNNEKWLILKKKYMPTTGEENNDASESKPDTSCVPQDKSEEAQSAPEPVPYCPPPPLQLNQDLSIISSLIQDNKPPMNNTNNLDQNNSSDMVQSGSKESLVLAPSISSDEPPPVAPRRRSSDKSLNEKRSSVSSVTNGLKSNKTLTSLDESASPCGLTTSRSESMLVDNEQKISVKERKQMFNRMASEGDVLKTHPVGNLMQGVDEEDRASLYQKGESDPLDPKQKQWILCAARGDYHALAKMCKENQKLARTKDPFTTALHWACKRGDENLVKLLAGSSRHNNVVNERSGYTPLHIAMQYRQEEVYKLLVEVYDADPTIRDWSGRIAKQYLVRMDTSLSPGSYRKAEAVELRRVTTTPPILRVTPSAYYSSSKKESFLRIGSLNVRVKKTTEAVSNFLGVGATRSSAYIPKSARDRDLDRRSEDGELHKNWGSADNIQKEDKLMPPPMSHKIRRRGANGRRNVSSHSRSTPSTPDQPRAQIVPGEGGDSDSDSAAGFHSAWKQQRASNCT